MSRCVGSSSTSRMRQTVGVAAEGAGSLMSPRSYRFGQRSGNSRLSLAELDTAVERLHAHRGTAFAFLESQLVAGPEIAAAARLGAEAVVDVPVEGLDGELGVDGAEKLETQVAVDRFGIDARIRRQCSR